MKCPELAQYLSSIFVLCYSRRLVLVIQVKLEVELEVEEAAKRDNTAFTDSLLVVLKNMDFSLSYFSSARFISVEQEQ